MQVRKATPTDLGIMVELGEGFYKQTRHAESVEFNKEATSTMFEFLMAGEGSCVFVATTDAGDVVGMVGGILFPLWMSPDHKTGQEMFWYVHPDHRKSRAGKLLFEALEGWATANEANSFCMIALSHMHENRVGQMYETKGYKPLERSYIKVF